jgi:hypothetical protein
LRRWRTLLALGGLVLVAAGCGAVGHMSATAGDPARGKLYFTSGTSPACASCHTLAAAGAQGVVGPNLDAAFGPDRCQGFAQSTIQDVVRGQIAYADPNPGVDWPPNSTNPVAGMPAGLANGQKAKDIAAYVASVAGITHGPGAHWNCQTGAEVG